MSHFGRIAPAVAALGAVLAVVSCSSESNDPAPAASPEPAAKTAVTTSTTAPAVYSASGNEPFWSVTVDGTTLEYSTPEMMPGERLTSTRSTENGVIAFSGTGEDGPFALTLTTTPCNDSMSGQEFEFTSEFTYGGKTLDGCGRERAR